MSVVQNMGPFAPVSFKGNAKVQAIPIFIDKLPMMIGGIAGPNAFFGRVVSVVQADATRFLVGTAAGRIVRGVLVADPIIMANSPAMNDFYFEGRPATIVTFGAVELMRYDLSLAAPTFMSRVLFNNTTGEIAFVASATAVPGGYTQLNAHVLDINLPNGVSIWLDYPAVTGLSSTPLVDVANPSVTNTPTPSGGNGTSSTPWLVTNGTRVVATTTTPGAVIYYTLDGTNPTMESLVFPGEGLILSTGTVNLRLVAVRDGMDPSAISNLFYTVA